MNSKYYKRDYDSNIWIQISYEYFCILKNTAYLTWWVDEGPNEIYEFCCNICGCDQYIEVVSGVLEKNLHPEHIAKGEKGYRYND